MKQSINIQKGNLMNFKKISLIGLLFSTAAIAGLPPTWYLGTSAVKAVRQNLNLNDVVSILSGTDDPSVVAKDAPKGSMYLRAGGGIYLKTDAGSSTNWTLNVSTTNTGDVTLAAVGSSPNANGATLTGQVLNLQPADATNPGVLTTGTQTIAGAKNLTSPTTHTGTAATDTPSLGAELMDATGWTSTGWTGSFAGGWTHTTGNVTALTRTLTVSAGQKYWISFTIAGRTAGSFTVTLGGANPGTLSWGSNGVGLAGGIRCSGTGDLTITPGTTFDGTISNISVKLMTASTPSLVLSSSDSTVRTEIRTPSMASETFFGQGSGGFLNTGFGGTSFSTGFGANALQSLTSGFWNTAVGYNALANVSANSYNTAVGYQAGSGLANGIGNTIIGSEAATVLAGAGANYNTVVGRASLGFATAGSANTAIGFNALGSATNPVSNTVIGYGGMPLLVNGQFNTTLGRDALSNIGGASSNNIGIGYLTGYYQADGVTTLTSSTGSIYIGNSARGFNNSDNNTIVIGNTAIAHGANTVTIGNASITQNYFTGTVNATAFSGPLTGNVTGNLTGNVTGNTSGTAATFTGSLTGDVTSTAMATTIAANAVTNAKAAQMAAHTFKGNNTGSTANASDLTIAQLTSELIIPATAISSTAIDWATANVFTKTLGANTTFTFSNQKSGQTIVVRLTNTASNYTVTWPTVKWAGGTPPTMTIGAHSDVYTFVYDGTDIYGSAVQNF